MHCLPGRWLAITAAVTAAITVLTLSGAQAQTVPGAARAAASGAYRLPPGVTDPCPAVSRGMAGCATLTATAGAGGAAGALAAVTPVGYAPADLRSAYGLPSGMGTGSTVAVVTPYDDPKAEADLAVYRSQYQLPACTTANGCFKKVNAAGGTDSYPGTSAGWSAAAAESLDMISAICPNCHILLVEADSTAIAAGDDRRGLGVAEDYAASQPRVNFIDNDWATTEEQLGQQFESRDDGYFNHPGVAITAPAGDSGFAGGISYPAASPHVIAVGGTTLTKDSSVSRGWDETAWAGTGSGCSAFEAKPSWQADTGCSDRALNDVAAVADPADPVAYYDTPTAGGWGRGSGTAAAAAIVAAAYALAGTAADNSDPASYLYRNASGLHDITGGSDGTCAPSYWCSAGAGYDGPTGLGSPGGVSALLSSYYQPVTPARVLDTRNGTGGITGPVPGNTTVKLAVTGGNGVPSANVTAVALNLTAVAGAGSGNIIAYPDGMPQPSTSNLNYATNVNVANLVIVPVGANGKIDLRNVGNKVQLIGDVFGYFTSDFTAAGDTTYTPVTPARILDTRTGTGAPQAQLGRDSVLAVQAGGAGGIPTGVSAVAVNITAVNAAGGGHLIEYADGTAQPAVSNLQFGVKAATAEAAIVPVGADGKFDIYDSGPPVDVVADVLGYFAPGTGGETYHAIPGTRVIDTRLTTPVLGGGTLSVKQPASVVAPGSPTLILDVIATGGSQNGVFTIYPGGTSMPATSNVNYGPDETIANLDLVTASPAAAGAANTVNIHNASGGAANTVVDCLGYFSAG